MAPKPKRKVFVDDKGAAIDLARSIADTVVDKVQTKIKMHHSKQAARANPKRVHERVSSPKGRLERAKAAVAAQTARAKREKTKQRKKARAAASLTSSQKRDHVAASGSTSKANRGGDGMKKRVSFT